MNTHSSEHTFKIKLTEVFLNHTLYGDNTDEEEVVARLRLRDNHNLFRIRSHIDLIQDTEDAIISFCKYGLAKYNVEDFGGQYLRLYGVLNAIYLQMFAIIELCETLDVDDHNALRQKLLGLDIYELRKILGSHTVNMHYPEGEKLKKNFFKLSQASLSPKGDKLIVIAGFGKNRTYNLYDLVLCYNTVSEKCLYDCIKNYLETIMDEKSVDEDFIRRGIHKISPFDYSSLYQNERLEEEFLNDVKQELHL